MCCAYLEKAVADDQISAVDLDFLEAFKCPLSLLYMRDPVVAKDGHSYEAEYVERHFRQRGTKSPMTNEPMATRITFRNLKLGTLLEAWVWGHLGVKLKDRGNLNRLYELTGELPVDTPFDVEQDRLKREQTRSQGAALEPRRPPPEPTVATSIVMSASSFETRRVQLREVIRAAEEDIGIGEGETETMLGIDPTRDFFAVHREQSVNRRLAEQRAWRDTPWYRYQEGNNTMAQAVGRVQRVMAPRTDSVLVGAFEDPDTEYILPLLSDIGDNLWAFRTMEEVD